MNNIFDSFKTPSICKTLDIISDISQQIIEYSESLESLFENVREVSDRINETISPMIESMREYAEYISGFIDKLISDNSKLWNDSNSFQQTFDESLYIDSQPNAPPIFDRVELFLIFLWQLYSDVIFPWGRKVVFSHYGKKMLFTFLGIS